QILIAIHTILVSKFREFGLRAVRPGRVWATPAGRSTIPLGTAMSLAQAEPSSKPKFDNNGQYSRNSILRYEKIFGDHYISTGGHETTENLCRRLGASLRPGARVLDVGSGIGGAAFHLAREYGAKVTGIDLAEEMVAIGIERAKELGIGNEVQFIL